MEYHAFIRVYSCWRIPKCCPVFVEVTSLWLQSVLLGYYRSLFSPLTVGYGNPGRADGKTLLPGPGHDYRVHGVIFAKICKNVVLCIFTLTFFLNFFFIQSSNVFSEVMSSCGDIPLSS